jgi:hypothetical protein
MTCGLTIFLYQTPNACKKDGKYYPYTPSCPAGDAFFCQTNALIVRSTHILFLPMSRL